MGSGSESDGVAVAENNNHKLPIVSDFLVPDLVILDLLLVQELPKDLVFKTAFDAFMVLNHIFHELRMNFLK